MTNRTIDKYIRVYADGYDISGYAREIPELSWVYGEAMDTALTDEVMGGLPGTPQIGAGDLSTVFDNTSNGAHDKFQDSDAVRDVMFAVGMGATPTEGNPTFCMQSNQFSYMGVPNDMNSLVTATIGLGKWDRRADTLLYEQPWGVLIHAKGAETGANSSTSDHDHGSQTSAGGYMMYQLFSSDYAVTLKIQDASTDTDGSYSDLLTTGYEDASSSPKSGIVALDVDATVERYTRWQLELGDATTCTFALAFVRGR